MLWLFRLTTENAKKNDKKVIIDLVITAGLAGLVSGIINMKDNAIIEIPISLQIQIQPFLILSETQNHTQYSYSYSIPIEHKCSKKIYSWLWNKIFFLSLEWNLFILNQTSAQFKTPARKHPCQFVRIHHRSALLSPQSFLLFLQHYLLIYPAQLLGIKAGTFKAY